MKKKVMSNIAETSAVIVILACAVILFPFMIIFASLWEVFNFVHRKLFK